jgi:hypothetical protein
MADVRDIMQDRLKAYERFLGVLPVAGESTNPIKVRNYQKGTITFIVSDFGGAAVNLVVEGTDNKGEDLWFNIDPCDENVEIDANGMTAMTYALEATWLRVRWVSGGNGSTVVRPSIYISKTLTG